MTSQLNVDTIVDKAGSGGTNVKVANTSTYVSDGGSATQNTVQGIAKTWINYPGAATSINDSLNISSLGDDGGGEYTYNYSNNFNNDDYSTTFGTKERSGGADFLTGKTNGSYSTSAQEIRCWDYAGSLGDPVHASATLHGDLA